MSLPPTAQEIREVARKAVAIFNRHGLDSCLFGSAGCSLYGLTRTPNDVDIIVMTSVHSTEDLKQFLVNGGGFYTRPSKKPGATYKVLYYSLGRRRSCKVDVLIPGLLDIPHLPSDRITRIDNIPVVPLIILILLKLRGWSDHRASTRTDMRLKQYVDVRDINQLLGIATRRGDDVSELWWLPRSFIDIGKDRIERFVEHHRQPSGWESIGFDLS